MLDPQKMVVLNLFSSLVVIIILLLYRKFFPKKKINFLFLITIISLPPMLSIFRPGSYESGDFTIHLYRTIEFYRSLSEGNLLPSWADGLNATYGYPLFIFNYPLPYYLISLFHFLGFSFIGSMKLFLASNFILSGIFMFISMRKLFRNDLAAFFSAIVYQFFPYHLIGLHFKVVIGEILIFTLLPLVFYFLQKLLEKKTILWFAFTSLAVALLIMSHVVLAFFALLLFSSYTIFYAKQNKKKTVVLKVFGAFLLGAISSIYIWLTPFFLTRYTLFNQLIEFVYFPTIKDLLFSPWRWGLLFQGSHGELSFLLGYSQIAILLILAVLFLKKKIIKQHKLNILFWIIALLVFIFLITPYAKFIWGMFPFLKVTGSHRLLVISGFIIAILAGHLSLHLLKKRFIIILLILITIFTTILNWGHRKVIPSITDKELIANVWKSTSEGEGHFYANSQWRNPKNPWFTTLPKNHLELITGNAIIQNYKRTSTIHTYLVNAESQITLRENTLYFPGWEIRANKKIISTQPDSDGIITFSLPKGLYFVEVTYHDLPIYQTLKTLGIIGFGSIIVLLILGILRKKK